MISILRVTVAGLVEDLDIEDGDDYRQQAAAIGADNIEHVGFPDHPGVVMVVDEDGWHRERPVNGVASLLAGLYAGDIFDGWRVVGDVLLIGTVRDEATSTSDQAATAVRFAAQLLHAIAATANPGTAVLP